MILREPEPVRTSHLFRPMRAELIAMLEKLPAAAWDYHTVAPGWTVKDIALHLLGDDIGLLSRRRDGFTHTQTEFESYEQLVAFINLQNDIWIRAARRMSPAVMLQLLAITGEGVAAWIDSLDMAGEGAPVDWAGDGPAPQWLEVAREYTEYWVHHQHICDAADVDSLADREYVLPLIATFVRALPRAYSKIKAPLETLVKLEVTGEGASNWYLLRERGGWKLYSHTNLEPAVTIMTDDDTLWRLFTRGVSRRDAEMAIVIEGNAALAQPFMTTTAILA